MIKFLLKKFTCILICLFITNFVSVASMSSEADSLYIISKLPQKTANSKNPKFTIVFNDKIVVDYGDLIIKNDGLEIYRFSLLDIDFKYINKNKGVEFYLPINLEYNTDYSVLIEAEAFYSDKLGYFKGIDKENAWVFKISDSFAGFSSTEEVSFYPNPASEYIYIRNFSKLSKLYVINLTGRIVIDSEASSNKLSVSKLPKGVYFITFIMKDGRRVSKKLIKK